MKRRMFAFALRRESNQSSKLLGCQVSEKLRANSGHATKYRYEQNEKAHDWVAKMACQDNYPALWLDHRAVNEIIAIESNHFGPPWSHILILGLTVIVIADLVWCIREILDARWNMRLARRIETLKFKLYEGARFIAGTTEWAMGSEVAIRVTIGQDGKEIKKRNGVSHKWTEVQRHTDVAPFYVRTAHGERVRVEPPSDVLLVDRLDQVEWLLPKWRRRRAELTPGERVIIEGRLDRGVDPEAPDGKLGWVMRTGRRYGMQASTEGLARRHELRARAFTRTAIIVGIIEVIAAAMVIPYGARLFLGRDELVQYGGKLVYQVQTSKGHFEPHHAAIISYDVGTDHVHNERVDVDLEEFERLPAEKGQIWIRHVPGRHWATALGLGTSVNRSWVLVSAACIALGTYFVVRTHRRRRWYEGPMNEKAQGPLPAPTNERFISESGSDKPPVDSAPRAARAMAATSA
ncbi:MAG TPA: hypothetical protein PK156_34465 [Polyangium sp.]|nr:hypothetical protein [Polyangium sp.]